MSTTGVNKVSATMSVDSTVVLTESRTTTILVRSAAELPYKYFMQQYSSDMQRAAAG
jgi:hypothetical protein